MVFDAVVVLGAAVTGPGVAGPALLRRARHGAVAVRDGRAPLLVLSGGAGRHPPPEAHLMRDVALAAGVPPERIAVEDRSRNTVENALFCLRLLPELRGGRLLVVSDSWHLPRALWVFRRLGVEASGEAPGEAPRGVAKAVLREALAVPFTVWRTARARHALTRPVRPGS